MVTGAIDDIAIPFTYPILINCNFAAISDPVTCIVVPGHAQGCSVILCVLCDCVAGGESVVKGMVTVKGGKILMSP